jgi:hypothetical protein
MKKYKNFITSGCSFTSGVVNATNLAELNDQAFSWPHYCLLEMGLENSNFLNFAMSGGGNIAAFNNLVYYIESSNLIDASDTLIGINLTGLDRYDTICHTTHARSNYDLSARDVKEKLKFNWIIHGNNREKLDRGITELQIHNCLCILQGITYLESKNFDYFFMLMNDAIYYTAPDWFQKFLDARQHRWVKFGSIVGMAEFVMQQQVTTPDGHPSKVGHKMLSKQVIAHLKKFAE